MTTKTASQNTADIGRTVKLQYDKTYPSTLLIHTDKRVTLQIVGNHKFGNVSVFALSLFLDFKKYLTVKREGIYSTLREEMVQAYFFFTFRNNGYPVFGFKKLKLVTKQFKI